MRWKQGKMIRKAANIYLEKNGKVLGVTRRSTIDQWGLPGGKVDIGEDYATAAIRELKEETGVVLDKYNLDIIYAGTCEGEFWAVTFTSDIKNIKEPKVLGGDAGIVSWIDKELLYSGPFGKYNQEVSRAITARSSCKIQFVTSINKHNIEHVKKFLSYVIENKQYLLEEVEHRPVEVSIIKANIRFWLETLQDVEKLISDLEKQIKWFEK